MKIFNKWVGYLDRSHLTIKDSILKKLGQTNPEMTDHSESNILVIIVSMFSGIAEQLNYYIDNMAREAFITTARKYSSVVKHTRLIDYRIKAAVPSSADILVELLDNNGNPYVATTPLLIPVNTQFSTNNGIIFISIKDVTIEPGDSMVTVVVQQKSFNTNIDLGTTIGVARETVPVPINYVDGSMILTIGGEPWYLVNSLGFSGPNDKHFIIDISTESTAYIQFGDGLNGMIPMGNQPIIGEFYTTIGTEGNVDANTINNSNFDFTSTGASTIRINNPLASVGGNNYQTIEQIRLSAPLSLRTLERGVTIQDYKDIAKLAPGIDKSDVKFDCQTGINVYISPVNGGIAQTALLNSTKAYIEERKIIGRPVVVQAAGESYIKLEMHVTVKPRRDMNQTRQDIINALTTEYGYTKSDVNRAVRKSDIYALVDNLEKVDWLNLKHIYTQPYFRPLGHYKQIIAQMKIREYSAIEQKWSMRYISTGPDTGYFNVFRGNVLMGIAYPGIEFADTNNTFQINIQNNDYQNGQQWEFTTLPYNVDQIIIDNSIPIIRQEDLTIYLYEQI